MAPTAPPRQVLRNILRHIKTPSTSDDSLLRNTIAASSVATTNRNASQTFVLEQFRAVAQIQAADDNERSKRWQQLASDYLALQRDLKERGRLYELDAGAEVQLSPREMSRRAAARAGLQLPEMDPE